MVSGGLNAANVGEAVRVTRAGGVDVSSGVERAAGVKDPEMIRAFIRAAQSIELTSGRSVEGDGPDRSHAPGKRGQTARHGQKN
jgi:phosphoribosylanthranilate isomerase